MLDKPARATQLPITHTTMRTAEPRLEMGTWSKKALSGVPKLRTGANRGVEETHEGFQILRERRIGLRVRSC